MSSASSFLCLPVNLAKPSNSTAKSLALATCCSVLLVLLSPSCCASSLYTISVSLISEAVNPILRSSVPKLLSKKLLLSLVKLLIATSVVPPNVLSASLFFINKSVMSLTLRPNSAAEILIFDISLPNVAPMPLRVWYSAKLSSANLVKPLITFPKVPNILELLSNALV